MPQKALYILQIKVQSCLRNKGIEISALSLSSDIIDADKLYEIDCIEVRMVLQLVQ